MEQKGFLVERMFALLLHVTFGIAYVQQHGNSLRWEMSPPCPNRKLQDVMWPS